MLDVFSIESKLSLFAKYNCSHVIDLEKWLCFVKHRDRNVISPKIDTFFGKSVKNEAKKDYIVTWVAMHIRFTRKFFLSKLPPFRGKSWIELTEKNRKLLKSNCLFLNFEFKQIHLKIIFSSIFDPTLNILQLHHIHTKGNLFFDIPQKNHSVVQRS